MLAVIGVSACGDHPGSRDAAADYEFIAFHWPASEPDPHVRMCEVFGTGEHIGLHPEPIIGVQHFDSAYVADPQEPFVPGQVYVNVLRLRGTLLRPRAWRALPSAVERRRRNRTTTRGLELDRAGD